MLSTSPVTLSVPQYAKVSKTFNIIPELLVLQTSGHQSGKSPKHAIPVLFMLCAQILPDKY